MPRNAVRVLRLLRPFARLLGTTPAQRLLKWRVDAAPGGPSATRRAGALSRLWGEVMDPNGQVARTRLVAPDGYSLTALTAVEAARRVLAGAVSAGFQTPSRAFGADFILSFPNTGRTDLP
jgi:short subunit dehydrogenase-like uncharacterized protein